jgi:hypothetical protein
MSQVERSQLCIRVAYRMYSFVDAIHTSHGHSEDDRESSRLFTDTTNSRLAAHTPHPGRFNGLLPPVSFYRCPGSPRCLFTGKKTP